MITKEIVNRIVNRYLEWESWCEHNKVSVDNDEQYKIWLEKVTKELNSTH